MAQAERVADQIVVKADWTEKDLASQVPGLNYQARQDHWTGPLTWGVFVALCGVFSGTRPDGTVMLTLGPELYAWYHGRWDWYSQAIERREWLEDSWSLDLDDRLYGFQEASVGYHVMVHRGTIGSLDCSEMGTGKSCVTLSSLRHWHQSDETALPALIICPNSVKHVWKHEAELWFPKATSYVLEGGVAKRRKQLDEALLDPTALVIVNYEAVKLHSRLAPYGPVRLLRCRECGGARDSDLTASRCHVHPKELQRFKFKSVVVDEAHRMKDPKSQQTRACWAVQHQPSVEHRIALTGTPIANNVGDIWSLMHGLAPQDFPTRTKFLDRYALMSWNHMATLDVVGVRPDTRGEFDQIVVPRFRRVLKEQVLTQLPPKVYEMREAPLTPTQLKLYRQMEDELMVVLEDGDVLVAPTNLVKATRLVQFASASCTITEDGQLRLAAPSAKLDVLEEILAEIGSRQVAVCALSRQLIELAAERLMKLGVSHRQVTGRVPEYQRADNITDFQEGRAQVMLFTVGAGGTGITLTAADTLVKLQRSWSMVEDMQAEDRVHRIGSERHSSITVIDIIAPGTIEVRQRQRLREKREQLEEVVHDREQLMKTPVTLSEVD